MTKVVVPGALGAVRAKWNDQAGQVSLYRRTVTLPAPTAGRHTLLTFESCFFAMSLYVNGTAAGTATGGYLPETFDITDPARTGANTIAVVIDPGTTGPVPFTITLRGVKGAGAAGNLLVTAPEGCTVDTASQPFDLNAGGSVTVTLHLSGTSVADGTPGLVRAVIDSETEAQPRQLTTTSANPGASAPTGAGSS